jgi:hypothetical protein
MRLAFGILLAVFLIGGFQPRVSADDTTNSTDPIKSHLNNAKAVHAKALQQAADALRAACDSVIQSAAGNQQADVAARLKSQEDAFTAGGAPPASPEVADAVSSYNDAVRLTDANLARSFVRAIQHYADQGNSTDALLVEHEKEALAHQLTGDDAAAPADDPASIAQRFAQARAQYKADAIDAEQSLLKVIDGRLNAATNAGDLQSVQSLQIVADVVRAGGKVGDGTADPAILNAAIAYRQAIQDANVRMARAFARAVHDFTRARQIDQAEAVQAEFVGSGLSSIDLSAVPVDGVFPGDTTYVLGRRLPDLLETSDRWDLRDRGIFLERHAYIRTVGGDYLDRDFTCDLWFTVETTGTYIFIGIGNGRGTPTEFAPENSLAMSITSPDSQNGTVGFLRADGESEPIGQLSVAGDYVARIQKLGSVLSMSVGDEDADGTFNPRFSTTISDAGVLAPFMSAHRAHLFFGGGRFWKIRYINGRPPAVIPDAAVKSLVE